MAKFIDRTNQIFNSLKILKELGERQVTAQCLICGSIRNYRKGSIIQGESKSCGCNSNRFINRTGQIFSSLKIVKELGGNKVTAQCLICGSIRDYNKRSIVQGESKSCGCARFIDRTGQIFSNLKIVKELGGNKITAQCLICGSERDYKKNAIVIGDIGSCGCVHSRFIDRTSQRFNGLQIIQELGHGKVIAQCILCGSKNEYNKGRIIEHRVECRYCGLARDYRGKVINSIKVTNLAYVNSDGKKYYNCMCHKCREKLLLTREEIVKYICNKE